MSKLSAKEVKELESAIASGHLSEAHAKMMQGKLDAHFESMKSDNQADAKTKKAKAKKNRKNFSPKLTYEGYEGKVASALGKILKTEGSYAQNLCDDKKDYIKQKFEKGISPYFVAKSIATGAVLKKTTEKDPDIDKSIEDCEEVVKANRKANRKEPVKHTSSTKLADHIKGIANTVLPKIKDDPEKIKDLQTYLAKVEIHLRTNFLGLKKEGLNDETKEKLEGAADKADGDPEIKITEAIGDVYRYRFNMNGKEYTETGYNTEELAKNGAKKRIKELA